MDLELEVIYSGVKYQDGDVRTFSFWVDSIGSIRFLSSLFKFYKHFSRFIARCSSYYISHSYAARTLVNFARSLPRSFKLFGHCQLMRTKFHFPLGASLRAKNFLLSLLEWETKDELGSRKIFLLSKENPLA